MTAATGLSARIAEVLKTHCTFQVMPDVARDVANLAMPSEFSGNTKREFALSALRGKSEQELGEIARKFGAHFGDIALEEAGLGVLEAGTPPITEITRRDVAACLGDDLSGERNPLELIRPLFKVESSSSWLMTYRSFAEEIQQHMVRNRGDWSVDYLFEQIGALTCSRDRFARLLESALHPLCRRGLEQTAMADRINVVLKRDGYALTVAGEESGYSVFRLLPLARGVAGVPKNLIFASNGPKPEIGFGDVINNDIVILSNASSCLVYERPIRRDGLLWSELVDWWRNQETELSANPARALGQRLASSLASDAEGSLFREFFKLYRPRLGSVLPALIPQVYLHYDPAIVKQLTRRQALPRQRMDFLLLLPNYQRVVIEVDGAQHFSHDNKPSLPAYARMVSADRDLRLSGYEIYRFGANELVGDGAPALIEKFFDRLWMLHKIS